MSISAFIYRVAVLGLFIAFVTGVSASYQKAFVGQESTTPVSFNAAGAPTIELSVPDMMCEDGCAWAVQDILSKQPGTKDVHVDFNAKIVTVAIDEGQFDSQSALAELIDKGFMNSKLNALKNDVPGTQWTSYPPGTPKQTKQDVQSETKEKNAADEEGARTKGT
jgi:copper chaperone CopZ